MGHPARDLDRRRRDLVADHRQRRRALREPHGARGIVDPHTHKIHITWLDGRGGGRLAYAVCAPGGKTCSAAESISDQPFAAYGYIRQGASWLGEYYGLVLDTKRKLLHAVWTQPVTEDGAAVARIFQASL
jgi:hypothetical protein